MRMEDYIEFLEEVSKSIEMRKDFDSEEKEMTQQLEVIRNRFQEITEAGCQDEFYCFLNEVFEVEYQEMMFFLDYLYEVTEELFFVSCRLDTALKKQMKNSGSYYRILQLSSYKNTVDFYLNRRRKKTDEWNLNFYLKNELQKKLNMRYTKIPVNERDQEYVVIVSTQILGDSHSPSLLTLHFSYLIEKYLKKKVLLLCTTESSDLDALNRIGVRKKGLIQKRYLDQNGKFNISYRERKIECYQICLDDQTWEEQCRLIEQIYERKPLCVWQFGGIPAFAAAMQQFTSFYYMQMNAGYPAVSADLVINYFQNSGKCYPDEWDMLRSNGVPVTNMFFTLPRPMS